MHVIVFHAYAAGALSYKRKGRPILERERSGKADALPARILSKNSPKLLLSSCGCGILYVDRNRRKGSETFVFEPFCRKGCFAFSFRRSAGLAAEQIRLTYAIHLKTACL